MTPLPDLSTRFPEPVVDSGADPYVVHHGDDFYYCFVKPTPGHEAICISKASTLDTIAQGEIVDIWHPPPGQEYSQNLWAPELHHVEGKWYVYFAAGRRVPHFFGQRTYVLEGDGLDPLAAQFRLIGPLGGMSDHFAIDVTVLELAHTRRYFVWSGRDDGQNRTQHLYIARMADPWTIAGERVKIASPVFTWEQHGLAVNEGPQVLPQGDTRHIIYSAAWSERDDYCLGQLSLVGDNPLDPTHWIKRPEPVFESQAGLIAPGHASFLLTPDQSGGWMIFHTARQAGSSWDRQVRLVAFELSGDGSLRFSPTLAHP